MQVQDWDASVYWCILFYDNVYTAAKNTDTHVKAMQKWAAPSHFTQEQHNRVQDKKQSKSTI